jgi:hypothetical protein
MISGGEIELSCSLCIYNSFSDFTSGIQSSPDTVPFYIPPPMDYAHESLGTEILYVISKGIPW